MNLAQERDRPFLFLFSVFFDPCDQFSPFFFPLFSIPGIHGGGVLSECLCSFFLFHFKTTSVCVSMCVFSWCNLFFSSLYSLIRKWSDSR